MPSFLNSKLSTVALGAALLWLLFLAGSVRVRHMASEREMHALEDRVQAGQRENARLASDLSRLDRPESLVLLARTRLNYKRPDETVVFVYKSENPGTISQPQATPDARSNWEKWRDWLRHR